MQGTAGRTRLRAWRGVPDGDGQRAAEGVDAHDGGVRMAGSQGSERGGCSRGAVQSLGHVRRPLQEELLCGQEQGMAQGAAGTGREAAPGLAALGDHWGRITWLLLGTPYRASAKSAARFNSTSWGRGRRQRDPLAVPGGNRGARSPLLPPRPLDTLIPSQLRPSEYLGQPLGISGVSGNDFL